MKPFSHSRFRCTQSLLSGISLGVVHEDFRHCLYEYQLYIYPNIYLTNYLTSKYKIQIIISGSYVGPFRGGEGMSEVHKSVVKQIWQ